MTSITSRSIIRSGIRPEVAQVTRARLLSFTFARDTAASQVTGPCAERVRNLRASADALEKGEDWLRDSPILRPWATPIRRDIAAYVTDPVDPLFTVPLGGAQRLLEGALSQLSLRRPDFGLPPLAPNEQGDVGVLIQCFLNYPAIDSPAVYHQSASLGSVIRGYSDWRVDSPKPEAVRLRVRGSLHLLRRVVEPYHVTYQKKLAENSAALSIKVMPGSVGELRAAIRKHFGTDVENYNHFLLSADEVAGDAFVDTLRESINKGRVTLEDCKLLLTRKHEGRERYWLPSPLYAAVARQATGQLKPDDPIAELIPYASGEKSALPSVPTPQTEQPTQDKKKNRIGERQKDRRP